MANAGVQTSVVLSSQPGRGSKDDAEIGALVFLVQIFGFCRLLVIHYI